ncbi:hypothetical protein HDU76_002928 [Blyttiomyces sp. JEL0837]|nr:hypothetical protein HDU76_002928 [Blyttiomyces sp. JEL0837]
MAQYRRLSEGNLSPFQHGKRIGSTTIGYALRSRCIQRLMVTSFLVSAVTILFWLTDEDTQVVRYDSNTSNWVPPPKLSPDHPWFEATIRAEHDVTKLSLEEKVRIVTGVGWQKGKCVGNIAPVDTIGFKGLCLQDGPAGIRFTENVTAFPASINVAATFDKTLMKAHGEALGVEARNRGVHVLLAPMMNMMRAPAGGRNWEGQGADPYLASISASLQVAGIQSQGVIATAKHLLANEQEHYRDTSSSNVNERVLMEYYMAPFTACVKEGVGAIMCSYNKLNGFYTCENSELVNHILKGVNNFRGFVMTDWWAAHSDIPTAMVTDMMMPGEKSFISFDSYFGKNLISKVKKGLVPMERIDDMVTRILSAHYHLKQDNGSFPETTIDSWKTRKPRIDLDPTYPKHAQHARDVASASTILLKNAGVLPLSATKLGSLAIIGEDAGPPKKLNQYADRGGIDGTLAIGWGSGTAEFPYLIDPLKGILDELAGQSVEITSHLENKDLNAARKAAEGKDAAIVCVMSNSGEAYLTVEGNAGDRKDLKLWHGGDELINAVASVNQNTIVVIHSPGAVDMPWIDHLNISAIVMALMPGQESGHALADVLFGKINPSGRLPFTIHSDRTKYAADVIYSSYESTPIIDYKEGFLVDYMHSDFYNIEPLYPFGFGLSYSSFKYSDLVISKIDAPEGAYKVSFTIANTSPRAGHEVAQMYVGYPADAESPPKLLKGFERIWVDAGKSVTVDLVLDLNEMKVWDTQMKGWKLVPGDYIVKVGGSSKHLPLENVIAVL